DDLHGAAMLDEMELPSHQVTVCTISMSDITSHGLDVTQMKAIHWWMNRPEQKAVLTLRNIRLTDQPYDENKINEQAAEGLNALRITATELQPFVTSPYAQKLASEIAANIALLESEGYFEQKYQLIGGDWMKNLDARMGKARFFATMAGDACLVPVPATLKVLADQIPEGYSPANKPVRLDAARGEGESQQILLFAGEKPLHEVAFACEALSDGAGHAILPELAVTGYVPVRKPTFCSFTTIADFPDPLKPNAPFEVSAYTNQSLWLTCWVPRDATPGLYHGEVTVSSPDLAESLRLLVELQVHSVTLPLLSKLKSAFMYRDVAGSPAYNGANWTQKDSEEFVKLGLKYHICLDASGSSNLLPWDQTYQVSGDGAVTADWTEFDKRVEYWLALGKNTFLGYYMGWYPSVDKIENRETDFQKYRLLGEHLAEKGWQNLFYLYVFDEPAPENSGKIQEMCDWIHDASPANHLVLTSCHNNEAAYVGYANIFCPHIDFYNPAFGAERQAAGDQYWMYTCCGTASSTFPDSWRIDYYGTGHRALGWWLFKYHGEGYLYWAVDYWNINPWLDAETLVGCNGEGTLFYPAPDHQSLPYPCIRTAILRDGFEDYDLLQLLKEKFPATDDPEIQHLLNADGIVDGPQNYNQTGDQD
ncbi:MAG: DUF4091 domain-containing protein, partial [Victivallales bacterium]|nr:DUF4091 domain-containing protein [Victivallales bacterium]